jgi:hypothetical protein
LYVYKYLQVTYQKNKRKLGSPRLVRESKPPNDIYRELCYCPSLPETLVDNPRVMLRDFKITYIYVNSYVDLNLNKM